MGNPLIEYEATATTDVENTKALLEPRLNYEAPNKQMHYKLVGKQKRWSLSLLPCATGASR